MIAGSGGRERRGKGGGGVEERCKQHYKVMILGFTLVQKAVKFFFVF